MSRTLDESPLSSPSHINDAESPVSGSYSFLTTTPEQHAFTTSQRPRPFYSIPTEYRVSSIFLPDITVSSTSPRKLRRRSAPRLRTKSSLNFGMHFLKDNKEKEKPSAPKVTSTPVFSAKSTKRLQAMMNSAMNYSSVDLSVTTQTFLPKASWIRKHGMRQLHPYQADAPNVFAYDSVVMDSDRQTNMLLNHLTPKNSPSFHDYGKKPPAKVLDLGCGDMSWVELAADAWAGHGRGVEIIGFDLVDVPRMLWKAGRKPKPHTSFVQGDFVNFPLPFKTETFDMVRMSSLGLVIPFNRWIFVLAEAHRVLKPGGRLEVIDDQLVFPYGPEPTGPHDENAKIEPSADHGSRRVSSCFFDADDVDECDVKIKKPASDTDEVEDGLFVDTMNIDELVDLLIINSKAPDPTKQQRRAMFLSCPRMSDILEEEELDNGATTPRSKSAFPSITPTPPNTISRATTPTPFLAPSRSTTPTPSHPSSDLPALTTPAQHLASAMEQLVGSDSAPKSPHPPRPTRPVPPTPSDSSENMHNPAPRRPLPPIPDFFSAHRISSGSESSLTGDSRPCSMSSNSSSSSFPGGFLQLSESLSPTAVEWKELAKISRDLEGLFAQTLRQDYGIHLRVHEHLELLLQEIFGSNKSSKTRSIHVKLAPSEPAKAGDQDSECGSTRSSIDSGYASTSSKQSKKEEKKQKAVEKKAEKVEKKLEKMEKMKVKAQGSTSPAVEQPPAIIAESAQTPQPGSVSTPPIDKPKSSQPSQMTTPAQPPGLVVFPDIFIPMSVSEVEAHTCRHMHSLLGAKAAVYDFLTHHMPHPDNAKIEEAESETKSVRSERSTSLSLGSEDTSSDDDGKKSIVSLEDFDSALWDYECFRRGRFNWPTSLPEQDARSHKHSRPKSDSSAKSSSFSLTYKGPPANSLTHIRSFRVYEATKNDGYAAPLTKL